MAVWPLTSQASLLEWLRNRRSETDAEIEDGESDKAAGGRSRELQLPAGAQQWLDVAYGPEERQKLDVYAPAGANGAPIVLFAHGGAWVFGDKRMGRGVNNKVARWLPRGVIVMSMNYRKPRPPDPAQQADDVARALAYVQAHAPDWGGDGRRIALMGHSAGAHLVSLVTADIDLQGRWGVKPWLGTVSLDSAAMDVVDLMEGKHPGLYDRVFGDSRAGWERVSPLHRVSAKSPPMLLVCSEKRADSCERANAYAKVASRYGTDIRVLPVNLGHGDINSTLGQPGRYTDDVESFLLKRLGAD